MGTLLGMNTYASCEAVLDLVYQTYPSPDLIVITGDIVQEPHAEAYKNLDALFQKFSCPIVVLFGNHDDPALFLEKPHPKLQAVKSIQVGTWQILLLHSRKAGAVYGHLTNSELQFLRNSLAQSKFSPTLVALHHPPFSIGCSWLDNLRLSHEESFKDILKAHTQVKAVLCGHIHQAVDILYHHVRLLSCPSTCIQFNPHSDSFKLDLAHAPGFRWFHLYSEGTFETGVQRLKNFHYHVDEHATGY